MNIQKLKIMPCPVNAGRHPYPDHRWIATEDTVTEPSENTDQEQWTLESGSLIAEMRDVDPAYARLFAAAPELLAALEDMLGYADARNCDPKARTVNMKFSRPTLEMWQEKARAAIQKADSAPIEGSDEIMIALSEYREIEERWKNLAKEYQDLERERNKYRDALKYISTWRKEAHDYDADMGHPARDFDDETVSEIEAYAIAELSKEQK